MNEIFGFIRGFYKELSKPVLAACTMLAAVLIYLNFHFDHDQYITNKNSVFASFYYRYFIFLIAFALPYFFYFLIERKNYFKSPPGNIPDHHCPRYFFLENGVEY